jgi:kynurenine formamidase
MPAVYEAGSGLKFVELSHPWGHGIPVWPGDADVHIHRGVNHARHGVLSQRIRTNMHCSTHLNAPIHLIQGAASVAELSLRHFFGSGVVLSIPKGEWELISVADLESAKPEVRPGDIVLINTGWHRKYSDSQEYFGHGPGLSAEAAGWLRDRQVVLVGIDTAAVDHPLATSLGLHRNGPQMPRLPDTYKTRTGRDPRSDFPDWNPAQRLLLSAGIPTLENIGGDLDEVSGIRCTIHAAPWRWTEGDACIVRLMAIIDPAGTYRLEKGSTTAA